MNLLFMDVETSGLNPMIHEVIEICLVETLPDGTIVQRFDSKIKPTRPVVPDAAKVNGYTPEKWADSPNAGVVWSRVNDVFGKCTCIPFDIEVAQHWEWCRAHPKNKLTPWGWNVGFDLSFIRPHIFFDLSYHPDDVRSLCRPFLPWDKKVSLSDAVRILLNREPLYAEGEPHEATKDVLACVELYKFVATASRFVSDE